LIDTLPRVWQMVVVAVSWQVGRALAAGAATPATTAKPANNTAAFAEPVIVYFPSRAAALVAARCEIRIPIRGRPI
jgi:hypothetical protein